MAEYNVKINVKTDTGYDQLYPKSKSDIIDFDKSNSNLLSNDVEAAIKEVNTKTNTNKTNIGTLTSLTTDSKTNLVGAINEVDSHANNAQNMANTNKTNIGTLSNLKTSIKTSIVNAINSLYDAIIGKTLKSLDDIDLATEEGFYADALAIKELNNELKKKINSFDVHVNDEWLTGETFGGKDVYERLIDIGVLPNSTTKTLNTNVSNLYYFWIDPTYSYATNNYVSYPIPYIDPSNNSNSIGVRFTNEGKNIVVQTGANWSEYVGFVAIKYTKQ